MKTYIPALRFHFATRLYDPVVRWTTREAAFKRALVTGLAAREGERILDLGCGTGTLAIAIACSSPGAAVVGIDADDSMLAQARAKQARSRTSVQWHRGFAQNLPTTRDSVEGVLPLLMAEAGFDAVRIVQEFPTALGTLAIYSGSKGATLRRP